MRILLALAAVIALALPGMAVADRATSSTSEIASAQSHLDKKKQKKKRKQAKKSKRNSAKPTTRPVSGSAATSDDEVEVKGVLVSLTPPTVGTVSCDIPVGMSLLGFDVGDVVEMTCDVRSGTRTLRRLKHEDDAVDEREDDHDDRSNSGSGGGDDDDDDDDNSGSGGGGDDDDDDD